MQEIFKEKRLFNSLLQNKDFNEIFDILLEKLQEFIDDESEKNNEKLSIILNQICLILNKINETIIQDLANFSDNKEGSSFFENSNSVKNPEKFSLNKLLDNDYFEESDILKKDDRNEKENNRSSMDENSNINNKKNLGSYLNILNIYEKCFPYILEFYTNLDNRPKKKIPSTYKNSDIEVLGTNNLSIVEFVNNFFEILMLNSKNKAFGYYINKNNNFFIEKIFSEKLRKLYSIFVNKNFFRVCFEDLIKYEMNNCLQNLIKNILNEILEISIKDKNIFLLNDIGDENIEKFNLADLYLNHILINNDLPNFIIFNSLDKDIGFDKTKSKINSGYSSCLIEIAEKLNDASLQNFSIKEILSKSIFI